MITEEIPEALGGERIDRVVAMLTGCSRAEAAAVIAAGQVSIDGRDATKPSQKLTAHQRVVIAVDPVQAEVLPEADPSVELTIVHEDADVIVIDKPAGLVVHPGAGNDHATLVNGLLARYPEIAAVGEPQRPGLVHRLDKGTSGLLVVARSERAYDHLVDQLVTHEAARHYRALVWGEFETPRGTVDAPIGRSRRDPLRMTVTAEGRPARTHYDVLATYVEPAVVTELECRLETGRTHQIRVHLRSIGHAVVGDDLYGGVKPHIAMTRPFLHASRLEFRHPADEAPMTFSSPLPADLEAVRALLA